VRDPEVTALRDKVRAQVDRGLAEDAARIAITLDDGRTLRKDVDHAIGSLERPMTDADLERKFRGLVVPHKGDALADRLVERFWSLEAMQDVGDLPPMTVPRERTRMTGGDSDARP
jgi:2-methylcitrate dehydratase PrpD